MSRRHFAGTVVPAFFCLFSQKSVDWMSFLQYSVSKSTTQRRGNIMKTINIKKSELISILADNLNEYAGRDDWGVYVDMQGKLDFRHNTYRNENWFEFVSMYNLDGVFDDSYRCPGDDSYNAQGAAEWIVEEFDLPKNIGVGGWDSGEFNHVVQGVEVELVQ